MGAGLNRDFPFIHGLIAKPAPTHTYNMKYNPRIHHRRSIRLKGYNYSSAGAYFITICTYKKEWLFGNVINGEMVLNEYGQIVAQHWQKLPTHHPRLRLDEWVVMPNHLHGILILTDNVNSLKRYHSISEIVRGFKTFSTRSINNIRCTPGSDLWQRNYYEHIIRNDSSLQNIRQYIIANPKAWELKYGQSE